MHLISWRFKGEISHNISLTVRMFDNKQHIKCRLAYREGPMVLFQRKVYFSKGSELGGGGGGGGGVQMLKSIETEINCDFPGGGSNFFQGGGGGGSNAKFYRNQYNL